MSSKWWETSDSDSGESYAEMELKHKANRRKIFEQEIYQRTEWTGFENKNKIIKLVPYRRPRLPDLDNDTFQSVVSFDDSDVDEDCFDDTCKICNKCQMTFSSDCETANDCCQQTIDAMYPTTTDTVNAASNQNQTCKFLRNQDQQSEAFFEIISGHYGDKDDGTREIVLDESHLHESAVDTRQCPDFLRNDEEDEHIRLAATLVDNLTREALEHVQKSSDNNPQLPTATEVDNTDKTTNSFNDETPRLPKSARISLIRARPELKRPAWEKEEAKSLYLTTQTIKDSWECDNTPLKETTPPQVSQQKSFAKDAPLAGYSDYAIDKEEIGRRWNEIRAQLHAWMKSVESLKPTNTAVEESNYNCNEIGGKHVAITKLPIENVAAERLPEKKSETYIYNEPAAGVEKTPIISSLETGFTAKDKNKSTCTDFVKDTTVVSYWKEFPTHPTETQITPRENAEQDRFQDGPELEKGTQIIDSLDLTEKCITSTPICQTCYNSHDVCRIEEKNEPKVSQTFQQIITEFLTDSATHDRLLQLISNSEDVHETERLMFKNEIVDHLKRGQEHWRELSDTIFQFRSEMSQMFDGLSDQNNSARLTMSETCEPETTCDFTNKQDIRENQGHFHKKQNITGGGEGISIRNVSPTLSHASKACNCTSIAANESCCRIISEQMSKHSKFKNLQEERKENTAKRDYSRRITLPLSNSRQAERGITTSHFVPYVFPKNTQIELEKKRQRARQITICLGDFQKGEKVTVRLRDDCMKIFHNKGLHLTAGKDTILRTSLYPGNEEDPIIQQEHSEYDRRDAEQNENISKLQRATEVKRLHRLSGDLVPGNFDCHRSFTSQFSRYSSGCDVTGTGAIGAMSRIRTTEKSLQSASQNPVSVEQREMNSNNKPVNIRPTSSSGNFAEDGFRHAKLKRSSVRLSRRRSSLGRKEQNVSSAAESNGLLQLQRHSYSAAVRSSKSSDLELDQVPTRLVDKKDAQTQHKDEVLSRSSSNSSFNNNNNRRASVTKRPKRKSIVNEDNSKTRLPITTTTEKVSRGTSPLASCQRAPSTRSTSPQNKLGVPFRQYRTLISPEERLNGVLWDAFRRQRKSSVIINK